ncbi:helix-turn-helix transcriptional regulator [Streptosporangium subroseum]|uniref:helix-turn-helix transcriptional regulator n=1 Tax=Streptosporangium subroseum TaxID=106412 RepID=UPI00308A2346|nr:WYL domain-containing protein [Streptosporangium subroseum]
MLETSARLLRLLSLLETRRDWTGTQLAERLGVTTRTVRNDIERLRSLGYPVDATSGVGGGYRLGAGAALPPLLLDDDEAVAVAIGLRTAAGGTVAGTEDSSVRALAKLERMLPSRLRRRIGTLAAAMVTLPGSGSSVDADTLMAMASACRDHDRLRFDYHTHDGAGGVRVTEPHRLVNSGRRWYLLAWDLDRRDWRTFRVDRIGLRLPAGPRFTPREMTDGEVADHLSHGLATATWRYRARVTVRAPAAEIAGRLPAAITIEPVDHNTCVIDVGSDTPHMLALNLGMLDADFRIDESASPELAEHLRMLSARYARAVG